MTTDKRDAAAEAFVARWSPSSGAERSNFQSFIVELCELLEVAPPDPATHNESENDYVFERAVTFQHDDGSKTIGRADLYKRGCFILEGKQSKKREEDPRTKELVQLGLELGEVSFTRTGSGKREGRGWDAVMAAAKQQAEAYAKALPKEDGWPPFIIVVDVGHVIEVYADFSLQGKHYAQFPDRQGYRIPLDALLKTEIRQCLKSIWTDPLSLDPARRAAEVTQSIAELLARLSQSLEGRGFDPGKVSLFLMRCLFTMFAEDIGLLRADSFLSLLRRHQDNAGNLNEALPILWREMNDGGFSPTLGEKILRFNGGLFKDATAVPLNEQDINWLILAAQRNWRNVEPAIFGTLLERALDPKERHKLGAHYTPRSFVERLVLPTVIEPLAEEWTLVRAEVADLLKQKARDKARESVRAFHQRLCTIRILDPACGTGNFLYVSMELLKRLEGEVLELLADLGEQEYLAGLDSHTVDPHQFIGLEVNPRAVAIAELVLWLGYLQWHFRIRGKVMPAEPVLKAFANIKQGDAVLEYDRQEILCDEHGEPLRRWDGVTKKIHPITGEEVPDPDAQINVLSYVNARQPKWPEADIIVGNPPFHGARTVRGGTEPGYIEALRAAYPDLPEHADFVMFWWAKAAGMVGSGKAIRSGLITTKAISQSFSRKIVEGSLERSKTHLTFAIPNHPWVDEAGSADVRIAMTVLARGGGTGILSKVVAEKSGDYGDVAVELANEVGVISAKLSTTFNPADLKLLKSNRGMSSVGYQLTGKGFVLQPGAVNRLSEAEQQNCIFPLISARELTERPKRREVIDVSALSIPEVRTRYPNVFQILSSEVLPERRTNARKSVKERWWVYGEARNTFRPALAGLKRIIVTPLTSKHRFFVWQSAEVRCDSTCVMFALSDAFSLGILSSKVHTTFAGAAGGRLGVGDDPRYLKVECFDPFPFPEGTDDQKAKLSAVAEDLASFRSERLREHQALTMTKMYNVLEKLNANSPLNDSEKDIYEMGLISVLRELHEEIDALVCELYKLPHDAAEEAILRNVTQFNKRRATEERAGIVKWLRPEIQAPVGHRALQIEVELPEEDEGIAKPAFPKVAAEQVSAIRDMLATEGRPVRASELARRFKQGGRAERRVAELLQILAAIGQAETDNGNRYFSVK